MPVEAISSPEEGAKGEGNELDHLAKPIGSLGKLGR